MNILIDGFKKQNSFIGMSDGELNSNNYNESKIKTDKLNTKGASYIFSIKIDVIFTNITFQFQDNTNFLL